MQRSTVIEYPGVYKLEKARHLEHMLDEIEKCVEPSSFVKLRKLVKENKTAYDSLAMSGRWMVGAPEALLRLILELTENNINPLALTEAQDRIEKSLTF